MTHNGRNQTPQILSFPSWPRGKAHPLVNRTDVGLSSNATPNSTNGPICIVSYKYSRTTQQEPLGALLGPAGND